VLIAGINFLGTTGVTFNTTAAVFTVNSNLQITATVPAGATTGPIRVLKPGGTAISGTSFTVRAGPANDNFANAQVITGNAGTVTGSNTSATKEPGEPDHAGNAGGVSLWYTWTAPVSGNWRFDTIGSSFDTLLAVYTGSNPGALTLVTGNDDSVQQTTSQVTFNAVAGNFYRIAVDGYAAATGDLVLNWALTSNLPIITSFSPGEGGFGTTVTINGTNFTGANTVRFGAVSAPAFAVNSPAQIIATVPDDAVSGPISITTSNGTAQSTASFTVTGARPVNDNFAARVVINAAAATVTGSNAGATREPGEPNHAANAGGASVWWTWTAPGAGTYTITTRGSRFDTVLGIYNGVALDSLALVASNDDGPEMGTASQVSITATLGATYQIAVDGYNGASGNIILSVYPSTPPQTIYYTGFEALEGFSTLFALDVQNGWTRSGSGQNGIVYNYFFDASQQAYLGVSSVVPGNDVYLWRPLDLDPDTNNRPVIVFSTSFEIVDSTDGRYDDFGWDVYNRNGNRLFFLDFDNSDLEIYYRLNDGTGYHATGSTFQNGQVYSLEVTMDFARNTWSATLDDIVLVQGQPVSATNNVALNLGDIDATWLQMGGTYGNNYMLFDNYYVAAQPSQAPRIITAPQSQSITFGASAAFLVVVDSSLPVTYQWQFNGTDIPGANAASLTLDNVTFAQAGAYRVTVVNAAGPVTSAPAVLNVAQLPDLIPYKPATWSDKLVAATDPSGTSDAPIIYEHQQVYINWAVLNSATNGNIPSRFYTQLFLDGLLQHTWFTDGLDAGFYSYVTNHALGTLAMGTHTLRIDTDTTGVVSESDENNNGYSRTILVSSTNSVPPQLGMSGRGVDGLFEFTLTGIPLRNYEIQASTNFTGWSPLGTLVITNGNGLLQFIDPASPGLNRRFYRARLLSP
jgi:hypothetical protein